MHYWEIWQLVLLLAVNILTGVSYYAIPAAWHVQARSVVHRAGDTDFVPVFLTDWFLSQLFVLACGTHHFVMLPAMLMSHGADAWYFLLLAVDGVMAAVSAITAFRAVAQVRKR